ncbi:MAG TPA: 1-acyl-sn-glycerol-3-phosphate acyltransferase [Candidatus Microsaccharimonas sp.]|jgi:1-acyl-sn-glycerol-3-phosphate acyltransferase
MKFKKNLNWFLRVWSLGVVARLLFPTKVVGREFIPDGPFVLVVGPHKTEKETVLVPANLWAYEFHIMAKDELFRVPIFGWILKTAGGIRVVRKNGRGADAITPSVAELKKGFPVLIFPEGTRFDEDADLHTGKTGAVRIALLANAPIVLAGLRGMTTTGLRSKRSIHIGEPFYPHAELNILQRTIVEKLPEGKAARQLTDRMMQRLATLADTQYIGQDERDDRA